MNPKYNIESEVDKMIAADEGDDFNPNEDAFEGGEFDESDEEQEQAENEADSEADGQESDESLDQNHQLNEQNDNQREEQPVAGLTKVGDDFIDKKGNVVDAKGNIIANAGPDRRHYVKARQQEAELNTVRGQLTQATQMLEQARDYAELPRRLGITPEDYRTGLEITQKFAQNPVEAARDVVARVMAMGYNATDILGNDVGNSVDMTALRHLVNEMGTAPQRQQQAEMARRTELETNASRQYNAFVAKYPDSGPHEDAIADLITKGDNPEVAYFKVKNFAIANGLDFNSPLGPQIAARAQNPQQQQRRNTPAPMGRGGRSNERQLTNQTQMADVDDDYASIIRSAFSGG